MIGPLQSNGNLFFKTHCSFCGLMTRWILETNPDDVGNVSSGLGLGLFSFLASERLFFFPSVTFRAKAAEGSERAKSNPSRQRQLYHISNTHTPAAARSARARLTANSQRGLRKGQKQRGQLVFSQLICQSGPQTSEHITVFVPDKSGWRGGEGRGGRRGCCHGL